MKYGLSDGTIKKLQKVFENFAEIDKVVLYGSRAKGNARSGSDIDLTLFGEHLDRQRCSVVADALDDLLLPYMIDLSVFHLLNHPELEAHIQRVGQVLYKRKNSGDTIFIYRTAISMWA